MYVYVYMSELICMYKSNCIYVYMYVYVITNQNVLCKKLWYKNIA